MALTLVTFHAHPDDEAIATGGTMALAAAAGHRVVLVVATGGEHGKVDDGLLADGETLLERRRHETHAAADILGVSRVAFLGFTDSGMMGEPTNGASGSFWSTPVDDAARRLAEILAEEQADVLTVYDDHGTYGHPDHIKVHTVGVRAAEMAATPAVYESTQNRDHVRLMIESSTALDLSEAPVEQLESFGSPQSAITTAVDVTSEIDAKRAAMAAHASQIGADSWFLQLPLPVFTLAFGTEWYIRRGADPGAPLETSLW